MSGTKQGIRAVTPVERQQESTDAPRVRHTEHEAQAGLLAVLRLCAAGKLRCSEKTRRPGAATVAAVADVLEGGDFYEHEAIAAFAWPMLLQAGGLAQLTGGRLALTPRGRAALTRPAHLIIAGLWQRWLNNSLLDEFSRVEEIKGQRAANVLTAAKPRRKIVGQALAGLTPGEWTSVDGLFTEMRATGLNPVVHRSERALWKLYLEDPQYGSLGYDGHHGWSLLQGRYTLTVLFEYAATFGLIDIEHVGPEGARDDYRDNWGGDYLDRISRYDGLTAVRLNPLGAYAVGLTGDYAPTPTPAVTSGRVTVLANFDIVALDGLPSADALLLDTFADRKSDRVWTLSTASLLSALDRGHALDELRRYVDQAASHPLPQTVTTLLDDTARRTGRLRDAGQVHLIECEDEALAALVVSDRRLRALCTRLGERHLVVSPEQLPAFRKATRALGYPLG
ncbi:XPB/Ssl2-like helicase family protein [Streptomyces sp. Ag109_O5-1]|uniref:helicase-associated domain-containing protein n=1 Tax=Streptomyces sp. Ag109_O5-1 TaxID=1938851 RepID=UPI000FAE09C4|nr:helicase-associated domain-containing protein [Streptomyces sp. Ag109_O5-1]RPE42632.1 XPB/Ssl2-like helicase family protein [Streptomyces sp. Ag109_O5-1]